MDISIIIVNYKNAKKTINCLHSLAEATWDDLSHEIIVVDNGSEDGSADLIAGEFPEIKLIRSGKNLGMGGGNNLGSKEATGNYIFVLNNDTAVKKDAILKLYRHLQANENIGVIGPRLHNPDGSLQYSCFREPKIHTPILRRTFWGKFFPKHLDHFLMKDFDHLSIKEVDWLMGSALLLRRGIMAKDGYIFDEKYFMYFEDTDLCRRVREKHGLKVVYFPDAEIIHDHARESADKPWYIATFTDKLAQEHLKSWIKYFTSK